MKVLLAKAALSFVLTSLSLLVLYRPSFFQPRRSTSFLILISSRLLLYWFVFHLFHQSPQSDVLMFYDQASAAAKGLLVYRDFESVYGPLFSYFLAPFVLIWNNSRALVLAMIGCEALAAWITDLFFRELPESQRAVAILQYALLPAPLVLIAISGQEDVWIWLFAALAFYLLRRGWSLLGGLSLALGFSLTKLVIIIGVAPLLFVAANPFFFLLGVGTVVAEYWLLYQSTGPLIFQPLNEIATLTPPSLWFLLNAAGVHISREAAARLGILSVGFVGSAGLVLGYFNRHRLRQSSAAFAALWCLIFTSLMVLSPKTLGAYIMFFQLPLIFLAVRNADRRALFANIALGAVATVQDSHWFRLGLPAMTTRPMPASHILQLVMDLVMLAALCYLAFRSARWLQRSA